MPDKLLQALEGTDYPWVHFGWSEAPAGDYGVYAEDGSNDLDADDVHSERAAVIVLDLFTRDDSGAPQAAVEAALDGIEGCAWYVNSIQFEKDTGYIHFEWICEVA